MLNPRWIFSRISWRQKEVAEYFRVKVCGPLAVPVEIEEISQVSPTFSRKPFSAYFWRSDAARYEDERGGWNIFFCWLLRKESNNVDRDIFFAVQNTMQYSGFCESEPWAQGKIAEGKGTIYGQEIGERVWVLSPTSIGRGHGTASGFSGGNQVDKVLLDVTNPLRVKGGCPP